MANYQFKPADRMQTNKMHPVDPFRAVMKRRPLGLTGLEASEIGLGTGPLGRSGLSAIPDEEAKYIIGISLDQEACLIDTAPTYGAGRAERLLGEAMSHRRHQALVVTKAGYFSDGHQDFSPAALRASLEGSLKRLSSDYVDVLLLHNPGAEVLDAKHPAWAELEKLKNEGKLRAFGAAVNGSAQLKALAEKTPAGVAELPFNIYNQEAALGFEAAYKKGLGIIASSPLDSGFLTGRYGRFAFFTDERARFSREEISRRADLRSGVEALLGPSTSEVQLALQFVLAHPAVSSAIPGAADWKQVVWNVGACQERLSDAGLKSLRSLWERELKAAPLAL